MYEELGENNGAVAGHHGDDDDAALAADYEFDAPDGGMYAPPTSVDH